MNQLSSYKKLSILFFVLAFTTVIFYFSISIETSIITSAISFSVALILILVHLSNKEENPIPFSLSTMVFSGFLIKIFFAYSSYSTIFSPFPDSFKYIENLRVLLSLESVDFTILQSVTGTSQFFYYYLMYFTHNIFGNVFSLFILNIFLFSISTLLFYRIIIVDFGKRVALISSILMVLSLNYFVFTGNILKDSLVLFLTMLIFYIYKTSKRKAKYQFLSISLLIFFLIITRIYAGFSVLFAIAFDIILNKLKFKKLSTKIFSTVILIFFVLIVFNFTFLSNYLTLSSEFLAQHSIVGAIRAVPVAVFDMFFAPYPWGVFSGTKSAYTYIQIDSAFAMIFSFSLLFFLIKFLRNKTIRDKMYIYLIPIIIHALALGLAYEGGATRQRIGVYSFIILIFVVGLFYKNKKDVIK